MKLIRDLILYCLILCSINASAQLLSLKDCYSGTKDDGINNSFKVNETDSNRYFLIGSSSENNFFDSISRSHFPAEGSPYRIGNWIVCLNENTTQVRREYVGYFFDQATGYNNDLYFLKYTDPDAPYPPRHLSVFVTDKSLNFKNPDIEIDSFYVPQNGLYGSYFTKGDSFLNLYTYQYRDVAHDQIHRYKLNSNGILSVSAINSPLRHLPAGAYVYQQIVVCHNKIFECIDSVLKIYDYDANLIAAHQIFNNGNTVSSVSFSEMNDSSVLLKVTNQSGSLNLIATDKSDALIFNIPTALSNKQYNKYSENIIDSNLVVPYTDNDSAFYYRYNKSGDIINRYAEKYVSSSGIAIKILPYNDTSRIALKETGSNTLIQRINRNGFPISSVQINALIFAQNTILSFVRVEKFTRTNIGRYFIITYYKDALNNFYSTLLEYNPQNNTLTLLSVLNTNCNPCFQPTFIDIFSNRKKETFVLANVVNECVRNGDVILYRLADGINTVKGKVYIDYNSNNTQDTGEPYYENARMSYSKNGIQYSTYLLDTGIYTFIVDTGRYNIECRVVDSLFTINPATRTINHSTYNNTDFINFALRPNGTVYDAGVILNNTFITRPGFAGTYAITYSNNGNYPISNYAVKCRIDNRLTVSSASNNYTINGDTLIWNNLPVLQPGERKTISVNFTASSPPTLNIGDLLQSTAIIAIPQQDTNISNNQYQFSEYARGSYDPNEKTVADTTMSHAAVLQNKELLYTIRFENIGNDTAFNITIKDTISSTIDMTSFKVVASSYPFTLSAENTNILSFYFKGINLPPKTTNAGKAHGFVSYTVKPSKTVALPDFDTEISNTAYITFDYNQPVPTNTATTKIQVITGITNNSKIQPNILIYPNPANTQIHIEVPESRYEMFLKLSDISGKTIVSKKISSDNFDLDVSDIPSGIYLLTISNSNTEAVSKIIITR